MYLHVSEARINLEEGECQAKKSQKLLRFVLLRSECGSLTDADC